MPSTNAVLSGKAAAGPYTAGVEGALLAWHDGRGLQCPVQQVRGRHVAEPDSPGRGRMRPVAVVALEEVMPSVIQPLHAVRVVDRQCVESGQREVEPWVRRQQLAWRRRGAATAGQRLHQ
jgi:hypothetical protein